MNLPSTLLKHPLGINHSGIIERAPSELKPWPKNPRTHSPKQLSKLMLSLREYGFTVPVMVDETSTILAGHGRVQAAIELGLERIPTRILTGLSNAQKRAYVMMDNKLGLESNWDMKILTEEMHILYAEEVNLELTGFSTAETDLMFLTGSTADCGEGDDLRLEDLPEQPVSLPGDLWILGDHRLLCGSALEPAAYERLLEGEKAHMVITDPPYNVKIEGNVSGKGLTKHKEFAMASGEMTSEAFTTFLAQFLAQTKVHSRGGAIAFVFMDWRHTLELLVAAKPIFGDPRQTIVWVKDNAGMGTFYRSKHELVYAFRNGDTAHVNNFELGQHGRYRTNVWEYPGATSSQGRKLLKLHPTVKPVSMIADAMRDCSHRGDLILDPFAGSGTILVAAERAGRSARAIELAPMYVDVGIRRWQRVTQQQAVLASTGQTWDQVRAERFAATLGVHA